MDLSIREGFDSRFRLTHTPSAWTVDWGSFVGALRHSAIHVSENGAGVCRSRWQSGWEFGADSSGMDGAVRSAGLGAARLRKAMRGSGCGMRFWPISLL